MFHIGMHLSIQHLFVDDWRKLGDSAIVGYCAVIDQNTGIDFLGQCIFC